MGTFSEAGLAFGILIITLGSMVVLLRLHVSLWKTIAAGCVVLALLTGLPLADWGRVPLGTLLSQDFIIMDAMLFGILLLSGIQAATGQSRRLVEGLEQFLRWPRVRLMFFPALVGLLPMPGGALFSCPMLEAASHDMGISPRRKVLINYWFRHMWELAWPLYPGYILVSSLLGLPLLALLKFTAPLVLFSFITGWFFFMRDIKVKDIPAPDGSASSGALRQVLYESLPLIITIGGAAVFGFVFDKYAPQLPAQAAFIASLACALAVAGWQGRGRFEKSLAKIAFSKATVALLVLIYFIYVFKDIIAASGIVAGMSHIGANLALVYALFIILPLVCGMLTGVMVGYVGACFPILLGILAETGLQEMTLPLIIVAMIAGNVGQLLTPLHVCVVVTLEYFKVNFVDVWRKLLPPLAVQMCYGILWAVFLYMIGAGF